MPDLEIKTEKVDFDPFAAKGAQATGKTGTKDYTVNVGGEQYQFRAAEGLSEEQQRRVIAEQTGAAAPSQTLRFDAQGNPIADLPQKADIVPMGMRSIGRAALALPGSVAHAGAELFNVVRNFGEIYDAVKQLGFSG